MFEVIEDALDRNKMDHDWKDYLGAGISGAFGGLGGNFIQQIVFTIAGGMTDAWLSGDLEQNGLWKTIGSIGASFVASYVFGTTSKFISNKIQINKLTNNKYLNKSLVEKLGINYSFNKNGKSIKSFTTAIKKNNWKSKSVANFISSETSSYTTRLLFGMFI